jgi:hypothetical protein
MSIEQEIEKIKLKQAAIDQTLEELQKYWRARPYLRLAQIVSNSWQIHPDYKRDPEPDIQDVYYFADSKFLEGLKLLIENESKSTSATQG